MASKNFDAVIVGGSITGLMHGVVLKALGLQVIILESRQPDQLKAKAAGLSLGPDAQKLMNAYVPIGAPYAIESPASQFLGADGTVLAEIPMSFSVITSRWNVVFEKLKATFEESATAETVPQYQNGKRVVKIEDQGTLITVIYKDEGTGAEEVIQTSLVIACDGCHSTIRNSLAREVQPKYAGYLAWRGYVPEDQTPDALKGALDGKLVMAMLDGSYILAYLTPGLCGSTTKGKRLLDWCWYDPCEENSHDLAEVMTDTTGYRHNRTVPRGSLSGKAWKKQLARAEDILPVDWQNILRETAEPFVTAITGFESSKGAFCDAKVLLAGEAFTQFRPHLGLSSNLSAIQALALAEVVQGSKTMIEWERDVLSYAQEFSVRSSAMGHFGMTGKWPEGYVPLHLQKKA